MIYKINFKDGSELVISESDFNNLKEILTKEYSRSERKPEHYILDDGSVISITAIKGMPINSGEVAPERTHVDDIVNEYYTERNRFIKLSAEEKARQCLPGFKLFGRVITGKSEFSTGAIDKFNTNVIIGYRNNPDRMLPSSKYFYEIFETEYVPNKSKDMFREAALRILSMAEIKDGQAKYANDEYWKNKNKINADIC